MKRRAQWLVATGISVGLLSGGTGFAVATYDGRRAAMWCSRWWRRIVSGALSLLIRGRM